jgi:hypothetical protein
VSGPRVLLCGTDAGGAANLAALQPALARRGAAVQVITRDRLRYLFGEFPPAHVAGVPADLTVFVRDHRVDAIICGTTCFESADRELVRIGAAEGVRTTVVLDERYNYRVRFLLDEQPIWPDVITLLDEESLEEAGREGLPIERCVVTGSPALAKLVARMARELPLEGPIARPAALAGCPDWPVLVFISETLAADFGTAAGQRGPLGPFAGYTEDTVRDSLLAALRPARPAIFVEKLHPAADAPGTGRRLLPEGPLLHVVAKDEPLWPFLGVAHAAIGMRSIGLLEAALLGVPALSFQPAASGAEQCTAVRLGAVPRTSDAGEAAAWCLRQLAGERNRMPPAAFPFAAESAGERVVAAALDAVTDR